MAEETRENAMTSQIETYYFFAANGVEFAALAVPASIEGPNKLRAPAGRNHAIVEFYDLRFPGRAHGSEPGQFVSYYRANDIMGQYDGSVGLDLQGGVDAWTVDALNMLDVSTWLATIEGNGWLE